MGLHNYWTENQALLHNLDRAVPTTWCLDLDGSYAGPSSVTSRVGLTVARSEGGPKARPSIGSAGINSTAGVV